MCRYILMFAQNTKKIVLANIIIIIINIVDPVPYYLHTNRKKI